MSISLGKMYVDDTMRRELIQTLESGRYVKGEQTRQFEKEFAQFCSTRYAIAVSSGTAAITVALMAAGIKPGDEIIMPSHSFIATATPALFLGAKPVFAEVDEKNYTISMEDVRRKKTAKTKAIIPVHLYGHPADMDPLREFAEKEDLLLFEDACQAHGAAYKKKKIGSLADAACFSFFPSKNMTVCGDGGMITTDDPILAEKAAMLRDHGRKGKYLHEQLGFNFRLSELHAALGRVQLCHVADWNEQRRRHAKTYDAHLGEIVKTPIEESWAHHVYHMYVIRLAQRDALAEHLKKKGIDTGVHYPIPIHRQPCITERLGERALPLTEKIANEVLSLPMHPQLTQEEIETVCHEVARFIKS